jgi:hypothetical protein
MERPTEGAAVGGSRWLAQGMESRESALEPRGGDDYLLVCGSVRCSVICCWAAVEEVYKRFSAHA